MAGIAPLGPLTGYPVNPAMLTPQQQQGGPADPIHGHDAWETPAHNTWEYVHGVATHGPPPVEMELVGSIPSITPAGTPADDPLYDYQPETHAAPWPVGVDGAGDRDPEQYAARAQESADIHASDMGASAGWYTEPAPLLGEWQNIDYRSIGQGQLVPIPEQLMNSVGGWGNTDRTQSLAIQNDYGLDAAHVHRRIGHSPIPGDFLWLEPAGRPIVLNPARTAQVPIGTDSPFTGQNIDATFAVGQAAPLDPPTEYAPPADPYTAATPGPAPAPGPVEGWF